ncbi:MAG: hypothetical protein ACP5UN_02870 [Candidatus Micrarchaeia archaeon]
MSIKLKLNPKIAYFLGLFEYSYSASLDEPIIGIMSNKKEIITEFTTIAVNELDIEPNKIMFEHKKDFEKAYFYNSKLKKLMKRELERKLHIFKYKNEYSLNYLRGIYDAAGGIDKNGIYIINLKIDDALVMENLGIHTLQKESKHYIINKNTFMRFIH